MSASAPQRARWLFTGVLVLLAAAAAAWQLSGPARYNTYEVRTREAVSGLIPGAPVEFHGVEVGQVQSVRLLEPRLVQVLVEVRREVPVTSATVATIIGRGMATRGFTGYMYVSLEEGEAGSGPRLPLQGSPRPLLPSAPSRVVSLDTSVAELNRNVQAVTGLLQSTLDAPTLAAVKQTFASLEKVTLTLAANNERMERILANAERATARLETRVLPQAQATLVRLDRLAATLDEGATTTARTADQAGARLLPLLQASTDTVLVLQTQVLPQAQRTLTRMDQLSATLDDTAGRIRRDPSLLVRGAAPPPAGPGE